MTVRPFVLASLCSVLAVACGDNADNGTIDARPTADAAANPDAPVSIDAPVAVDGGDPDAITDDAMVADADTSPDANTNTVDGGPIIAPMINEAVKEHNGINNMEFVEIFGTPNTDYSMYTVITLDGDAGTGLNAGVVDSVHQVGTTDANGIWATPFLNAAFENGSQTFLLVHGFSGAEDDDLDTGDDGTLDSTPWNAIVDSVAFDNNSGGDFFYGGAVIIVATGNNNGGGASRIPNGVDTNQLSDWTKNVFNLSQTPAAGEAFHTRGLPNMAN